MRCGLLNFFVLLSAFWGLCGCGVDPNTPLELKQVKQVVLVGEISEEMQAAFDDLNFVWLDAGVGRALKVRVIDEDARYPKRAIVCKLVNGVEGLSHKGSFSIVREGSRVWVRAATQDGLINGLYAICGDLLGARWYWGGELGYERVGQPALYFPDERWLEQPSFVQRQLYPVKGDFARRNRLVKGYHFNHALAKIFNKEVYRLQPNVFAEIDGEIQEPSGNNGTDPNPNLAHPQAVNVAAAAAIAHFRDEPESESFSLSITDVAKFDESVRTQAAVTPLSYFRGRPNYTDYVFRFMNAVAERVFDEEGMWDTPDGRPRYLTALAYYWTEQSPSFPIHSRVMPVLTSDRGQWHDPDYEAEDRALIERWTESGAERVATWDYYFGAPFPYPRQFNQNIISSIQHLNANGVDVLFSQLPTVWGHDGAKAWLATQLLWDSQQDTKVLLDEYYTNFFGAAGERIRAFYEYAEVLREEREGAAFWLKGYLDEAAMDLFKLEDLQKMRAMLKCAAALVENDERRLARVEVVSEAFRFTELYADYQRARLAVVSGLEDAEAAELSLRVLGFIEARAAFDEYAEVILQDPMFERMRYFMKLVQSDPVPLALYRLVDLGGQLPADLVEGLDGYAGAIAAAQASASEATVERLPNPSLVHVPGGDFQYNFLTPRMPKLDRWLYDIRPSEALSVSGLGNGRGLRVSGADLFRMNASCPVVAGDHYLLDVVFDAYQVSMDCRVSVRVRWLDANQETISKPFPIRLPTALRETEHRYFVPLKAPEGAVFASVMLRVSRQYAGDFVAVQRIGFAGLEAVIDDGS